MPGIAVENTGRFENVRRFHLNDQIQSVKRRGRDPDCPPNYEKSKILEALAATNIS